VSDLSIVDRNTKPLLNRFFSPIRINGMELENRSLMSSIHLNLEDFEDQFERMAYFYAKRAAEGVGLIVTSGCSPDVPGMFAVKGFSLKEDAEIDSHRIITDAVHQKGGKIALQIMHFGREAVHGNIVSSSNRKLASSLFTPKALEEHEILAIIDAFAACAQRAVDAGYDAIELIFSQGFLVHQFLAPACNTRTDAWGGSFDNRSRLAIEIARHVRAKVGPDYPVIFRIPCMDLLAGGLTEDESIELIRRLQPYGVDLLSVSIGWHDSDVPTIAMVVPRAGFASATRLVREHFPDLKICISNRINDPRVAESLLIDGGADVIAMARPFLADSALVSKARRNAFDQINPCIACNQNCLDYVFSGQPVGCSVNPEAVQPDEGVYAALPRKQRVAVVGGGIAGMGSALFLARRGAAVDLFEAGGSLGGQLRLAARIPEKDEFLGTVRYYTQAVIAAGVKLHLGTEFGAAQLAQGYDHVVIATGCTTRHPENLPGADMPHVIQYSDVLENSCPVEHPVVIIGGGGVACDVAKYLMKTKDSLRGAAHSYLKSKVADDSLSKYLAADTGSAASVTLLQRSSRKFAFKLGRTTRWIQMADMERLKVSMRNKVDIIAITRDGVEIFNRTSKLSEIVPARTVVLAVGHEPRLQLLELLAKAKVRHSVVGSAATEGDLARRTNISSALGDAYQMALSYQDN